MILKGVELGETQMLLARLLQSMKLKTYFEYRVYLLYGLSLDYNNRIIDYLSIKVFGNTDYSVDYSNNPLNNPLPNGALSSS